MTSSDGGTPTSVGSSGRKKTSRMSKTTDDITVRRRDSGKQLDRLLTQERLREESITSNTSNMSELSAAAVMDLTNTSTGRVKMHSRDPSNTSFLSPLNPHHRSGGTSSSLSDFRLLKSEDLTLDINSSPLSRSSSRCNSPTPTKVGMAARKFLARGASSSSVDVEDDKTSESGDEPKLHAESNRNLGNRHNRQSVSDENLRRLALSSTADDSFEFENLQRLSELNLLAVAEAEKKRGHGRVQSASARNLRRR